MFPTGTVTFLFTDIEGSTPLWEQMLDEMRVSVAAHHAIINQAIETHAGQVFQIIGDAFQASFRLPGDGLRAALAAQEALRSAEWGRTGPIRVRMGLHTGTAEVEQREGPWKGEYAVSHTLNRAARVMSAGHGGQILMSQETANLVARELPEGVRLLDLGTHRLKGMQWLEHLFQVTAPGLPEKYPPLNTTTERPNNLPNPLTSFIGREKEITEVTALLQRYRLVTLNGSGGTGKTRLSLEVAGRLLEDHEHGAWFVELAPLSDPALVMDEVARIFHLREEPGRAIEEVLEGYLQGKHLLLILDNCEHLLEACASLAAWVMKKAPKVRILASSREALGITGEAAYRVPSLGLPGEESLSGLAQSEAARLFLERAEAANPALRVDENNAGAVAQICKRLDGIALAIELAASRVRTMGVEVIAARLDDRFRLLTGGSRTALPRQQTLRATIDWSYNMLVIPERVLLWRLSVFAGGWTLEAAETICAGTSEDYGINLESYDILDILSALVMKSLVVMEQEEFGNTRYRMLETVRQYAREKLLDSSDGKVLRDRCLEYFARWVESNNEKLNSREHLASIRRFQQEFDNLRSALEWSLQGRDPHTAECGLQIIGGLWLFLFYRGHYVEGLALTERVLTMVEGKEVSLSALSRALCTASALALFQGYFDKAEEYTRRSLETSRKANDVYATVVSLHHLGMVYQNASALDLCEETLQEGLALAQQIQHQFLTSLLLIDIGGLKHYQQNPEEAYRLFLQALEIARVQEDPNTTLYSLLNLSTISIKTGDFEQAQNYLQEGESIKGSMDDPRAFALLLCQQAELETRRENFEAARMQWVEGLRQFWEIRDRENVIEILNWLAICSSGLGDFLQTAVFLGASQAAREQYKISVPYYWANELAALESRLGERMGEADYRLNLNKGREMTLEQVVTAILAGR